MTTQEQYAVLLKKERENELIPFLRSLDSDQRKLLGSQVKELAKEYFKYNETNKNGYITYSQKASPIQSKILQLSAFVCCNRVDFEKVDAWGQVITEETLSKVLSWYCPIWLSEYINKLAEAEFLHYSVNYHWIMDLTEKGLILPKKELIVKLLPAVIFESRINYNEWIYKPENLLKRRITLEEHLWYVFELESGINWSNRYKHFPESASAEEIGWIPLLKRFSMDRKLDRERLLKESLLATTRNFNKTLSGWYAELFIQLEPSKEELLVLQKELLIAFNSPHSKPVNASLNCLKKLVEEEGFRAEDFLDNAPLLLASEIKAIVASVLTILEKIAVRFPDLRENICLLTCQALVHKDAEQQKKVARLLVKYGNVVSVDLKATLAQYEGSLLIHAKTLLSDFMMPVTDVLPETRQATNLGGTAPKICIENQIEPIENFEDLLFLTSQAFDNNQSYHLDLLLAALIRLQHEVRGENIAKLEPAFQRAYKIVMGNWQGATGFLDHMLATFFIDYARILIGKFPHDAQSIQVLHEKYVKRDQDYKAQSSYYSLRIGSLEGWHMYNKEDLFEPFKQLLLHALAKLRNQDTLPLLSTPTHTPGWIDPNVFIERLSQYQATGVKPHGMDLQIAISRLALENKTEAIQQVDQKLVGEYRSLLRFLLIEAASPPEVVTHSSAWILAGLTKKPSYVLEELPMVSSKKLSRNDLAGQYPWEVFTEEYSYNQYDYTKKQSVEVRGKRGIRRIELQHDKKKESGFKIFLSRLIPSPKEEEPLFYQYLTSKSKHFIAGHNDIRRLLLLMPNNPEPILAQIVDKCLSNPLSLDVDNKKILIQSLQTLHEVWRQWGEMAHLLIAACMISGDKTVRAYAAEIWIQGVDQGTINSVLLGEIIGKHEAVEFAPLKRFTDLLVSHMSQISDRHNRALEEMLTNVLIHLPEKPITNLKKLLEIYLEVLSVNRSFVLNEKLLKQFSVWKSTPSLTPVIASFGMLEHKSLDLAC